MARSSRGVSAVSRVLAVLDTFDVGHPFLTLSEIARRARIPVSSAHGIVGELVSHGLLERLPDRSYRVGTRLWELGSRTAGIRGLRELALPHLQAAQRIVRQHTQLAVRADLDVVFVERLSSRDGVVNASIVGDRIPLQHSSSGVVLLAHADEEVLARVLERGLDRLTDAGIGTEAQLRRAIAGVHARGHVIADGWIYPGSRGIAVPVTGSQGVVVGAVGVVVPNDGSPPHEHIEVLTRTSAVITDTLLRSYLPPDHPGARPGGAYRTMMDSSESSMAYLAGHTVHGAHGR